MRTLYNKKGQVSLSQAPAAIQTLIIIGIFLAIAAMILSNVQTSSDPEDTAFVANETVTQGATNNNQTVALNNDRLTGNLTRVYNASNGDLVVSGNFTIDATSGTINVTESLGAVNVTYTYFVDNTVFNVTNDSLGGFDTFGGFLGLIALVIAAAIILGLVRVFG